MFLSAYRRDGDARLLPKSSFPRITLYVNESREKDLFKIRPEELGVLDQLLDDVRNLKSRSNIVKLCEMTVRMRRHAPFNVMLIYLQRPNATHVHERS